MNRPLDLALTDHKRMCYSKPKLIKDKPYEFDPRRGLLIAIIIAVQQMNKTG